ncbi:hypothetical protein ACP6L2_05840 [Sphingobacterium lactis]|uniref:hypothetical protein n=1 Tax=Sphingobacterium lactis TaxID=797291 RepID=UPI003F7F5132
MPVLQKKKPKKNYAAPKIDMVELIIPIDFIEKLDDPFILKGIIQEKNNISKSR